MPASEFFPFETHVSYMSLKIARKFFKIKTFQFALRSGNEKDTDEAADTVGCCSLRVEHIKLHDQSEVNGEMKQ